jgi:LmbE family N-acetylglucosaminyl deacetylase
MVGKVARGLGSRVCCVLPIASVLQSFWVACSRRRRERCAAGHGTNRRTNVPGTPYRGCSRVSRDQTGCVGIISPHPDDAALSVGGIVGRLGDATLVLITCFTQSCSVDRDDSEAMTRKRLLEDEEYSSLIGATLITLDFPDTSIRTNAGRAELDPEREVRLRNDLLGSLDAILQAWRFDVILAPSAIGDHTDHEHCREIAVQRCTGQPLYFYEDLPYAQMHGGPDRVHQTVLARCPQFRSVEVPLCAEDMRKKMSALSIYRSQIHPEWARAVEMYAAALSTTTEPYAERIWTSPNHPWPSPNCQDYLAQLSVPSSIRP